jgi:hypothetical protein
MAPPAGPSHLLSLGVTLAAAAAATTLLIGGGAALYWKKKDAFAPRNTNDDAEVVVVDLLPMEQTLAAGGGGDNAMSALTWFKSDKDVAAVESFLKDRTAAILQANPWLTGRVRKVNGKYCLMYNKPATSAASLPPYFHVVPNVLARDLPLLECGTTLADRMLKTGPTESLFRVSIYPCAKHATRQFAVVVSMSHVIGDGFTFFKIQNMLLNQDEPVEALEVRRIVTTEEQTMQAMGGPAEVKVLSSGGFIVSCIAGVLRAALFPKKYGARACIFMVDPQGMEETKKAAVATTDSTPASLSSADGTTKPKSLFVSTNDVLTNWFLQNCNSPHGFMAMNFRGRLEGHSDAHAGNYENVVFYRGNDSASPLLIRQSITPPAYATGGADPRRAPYQRRITANDPMPTFYEMITSSNAICTNWASFAKPCKLPACTEEVQIPLYNVQALIPSTLAIALIFRAGPQGLGVFVAGSPEKMAGLAKEVPFLNHAAVLS